MVGSEDRAEKKPYQSPKFVVFGNLAILTQRVGNNGDYDSTDHTGNTAKTR